MSWRISADVAGFEPIMLLLTTRSGLELLRVCEVSLKDLLQRCTRLGDRHDLCPGLAELCAVASDAMHDHRQPAGERNDGFLLAAPLGEAHRPGAFRQVKPLELRKVARLMEAGAIEVQRGVTRHFERCKPGDQRIRFARHLRFPLNLALPVNNANTGAFQ